MLGWCCAGAPLELGCAWAEDASSLLLPLMRGYLPEVRYRLCPSTGIWGVLDSPSLPHLVVPGLWHCVGWSTSSSAHGSAELKE